MEPGGPDAAASRDDRPGRLLVILMVVVLTALILSWAAFFVLR